MDDESKAAPDPRRQAVALTYEQGGRAPRVVAKGYGLVADQIIDRARAHGIHLHESREMVQMLMQVDLDRDIPPALYRAVAELLAWIYRIEKLQSSPTEPPLERPK